MHAIATDGEGGVSSGERLDIPLTPSPVPAERADGFRNRVPCEGERGEVAFARGSIDLGHCDDVVQAMVDTMQSPQYASRSFQIVGVRDGTEPESLARARADALRRTLVSLGVAPGRLEVVAGPLGSPAARVVIRDP